MSDTKHTSIVWDVITKKGKLLGPYPTDAILRMINQGALQGDEKVRRSPDGKWIDISTKSEFYDALINALNEIKQPDLPSEVIEQNIENINQTKSEILLNKIDEEINQSTAQEVSISKIDSEISTQDQSQSSGGNATEVFIDEAEIPMSPEPKHQPKPRQQPATYVETRKSKPKRKQKTDLSRLFMAAGFMILGAVILTVFTTPKKIKTGNRNTVRLLGPKLPGKAHLKPEQVKDLVGKAVQYFVKDTTENYEKAQSLLISVIEGTNHNLDAFGTLCLVYKELWQFSAQSPEEQKLVLAVTQTARNLDPVGVNGTYCDVIRLEILGKFKEAKGVVEHTLEDRKFSTAPILYWLKAELVAQEGDFRTAALYSQKASELWPEWIKPIVDTGIYFSKVDEKSKAINSLMRALNYNPSHKRALLEYGVMLSEHFNKDDDALKTLIAAVGIKSSVPSLVEARGHYQLAKIWFQRKNLEQAKQSAKRAFELNPAEPKYKEILAKLGADVNQEYSGSNNDLIFLGDQFARTGNCLAAQGQYKAAYEMNKKNGVAAMKAARCLWTLSQSQEAIRWLNLAIKAEPKLTQAYILQADYLSARYDYGNSVQILNKAARLFPNNSEVLKGFGLIEFRRNNVKSAIGFLQRSLKLYENDTETLVLLAKAHAANNEFPQAQRYVVRALELDSTNQDAQVVYGKILTQFQGLETGVVYMKDLINKFSYTIEFRIALAEMYREQSKYKEAQTIYGQILQVEARNKKALLGIGESLNAQGLRDKALSYFLSATLIDPSDPEGLIRAGLVHLEANSYKQAIMQFQRAGKINPMYPKLNYYIGKAAMDAGDLNLALSAAKEEKKNNPNLADPYLLTAQIYFIQKQYQKCAEEYQQVIKIRPQGAMIYVNIARCYRFAGSPDIAESMINIAAAQESGLPEVYKEQGYIFEARGDGRAAAAAFNKYLALSPNAPDKNEIESKITTLGR